MKLSRHLINLIILSCASSKIYSMEEVKPAAPKQDQQIQTVPNQVALSSSAELNVGTNSKSMFVWPTAGKKKGGNKTSFKTNVSNQFSKLTFEELKTSKSEMINQQAVQSPAIIEKKSAYPRIDELSSKINELLEDGVLSTDVNKRATQLGKIVLLCHEARASIPRIELDARKKLAEIEKQWQLQINSLQPTQKNRVFQETSELSGYTSDGEYKADEQSYGKFKTKNNLLAKITAQENFKNIESQKLIKQQQALQKSIQKTTEVYDGLLIAKNALVNLSTSSATAVVSDTDATHLQLKKLIAQKENIAASIKTLNAQRDELTGAQIILHALQKNDADFVTEQKNILNQKVTDAKVNLANLVTQKSSEKNPAHVVELDKQIVALNKQIGQDEADMKVYANHEERMKKRMTPADASTSGWLSFISFGYLGSNENSNQQVVQPNPNKEEKK